MEADQNSDHDMEPLPLLVCMSEDENKMETDNQSDKITTSTTLPVDTILPGQFKRIIYAPCNFSGCCKVYKGPASYRSLWRHQNNIHAGQSYLCHFCNKEFHSSDAVAYHEANICDRDKLFTCHLCQRQYEKLVDFNFHNSKHEVYVCSQCSRICHTPTSLKAHEKIHITIFRGQYFTCNVCLTQYMTLNNLSKHKKKKHSICV